MRGESKSRGWSHAASVLVLGFAGASAAYAESVDMQGEFPARYRDAAMLLSLSVERIDGQDGRQLQLMIERALTQARHFDIVAMSRRSGGRDAEGALSGVVTTGVGETRIQRKRKRCVERDDDGGCTREEEHDVRCTQRVVTVRADLRIVRLDDGRVVYSRAQPTRDVAEWCPNETPNQTVEEVVSQSIAAVAAQVRDDIVPSVRSYSIRFRESTSGLPRELRGQFRDIVRMTQTDLPAACAAWEALDAQAPDHPSIVFDLGLCAEARGNYEDALAFYRRAAPLMGRDGMARQGAERVSDLIAGRDDARARAERS